MPDRTDLTESVVEMDKAHHVHPFQFFESHASAGALPIEAGEGAAIYDTDGNRYLDAVGGMWCTNIGLGNEEMVEAIADQVRRLAYSNPFVDMTNIPATRLAARIAELAPGDLDHVFFTTGGSTAIDSAFRLVHFYQNSRGLTEKVHVISRDDSYHGSTYAAMSIGGKKGDHPPYFNYITDTVHHVSSPNHYRYGGDRSEQEFADDLVAEFEAKVDELGGPTRVAAFFAEPVMGSGGVVMPPADYLQRIWRYCRDNDILYVSDEVVTAWGRLGEWFASESLFGIQPDIITTAKGLTSGYIPMGAMIFSDRIFDVVGDDGRYFANGFTYSSHPVAAAAALKNIEIMEREQMLDHVREVGPYFLERLGSLADLAMVGDVRGHGLMACVEFVADKETKRPYPEELDIGKRVSDICDEMGLMVRPIVNLNVMSPPLVVTRDDVDFIVTTLRSAIVRARAEMEAAGHH